MSTAHILVVEDEDAIRRGLVDNLTFENYDVQSAADAERALELIARRPPDLLILDVMLPGMSGFHLCRRLRKENHVFPILMLTARGEESDRVMGLDIGADDYVVKPFSVLELLARVRALLRRSGGSESLPDRIRIGNTDVDFLKFEAGTKDKQLSLSRKEFAVLRVLASRPGEVFSRDDLLDAAWGKNHFPNTRTVDNHISLIRSKLEPDPDNPTHIITVHGVGYKLVPDS